MDHFKNYANEWEKSYARGDNNILYPQAEAVRFLNRFIVKRNSDHSVERIIDTPLDKGLRGLDFACGVGTHCAAFYDFGIEGFGADISSNAVKMARRNASKRGIHEGNFSVLDADDQVLPYEDNFFDFIVAESCLDSMPWDTAKSYISELKRVCNGFVYASFIGRDDNIKSDEFEVKTEFEKGTIQTVFDYEKIYKLFGVKPNKFKYFCSVDYLDILTSTRNGKRYYCVLDSEAINEDN